MFAMSPGPAALLCPSGCGERNGKVTMNRRSFLRGASGAILAFTRSGRIAEALERDTAGASPAAHPQNSIVVSAAGDDKNPGTISRPLKSFQAAQAAVRNLKQEHSGTISVYFRAGTYYLPDTFVFSR